MRYLFLMRESRVGCLFLFLGRVWMLISVLDSEWLFYRYLLKILCFVDGIESSMMM